MTFLFAGGELSALVPSGGGVAENASGSYTSSWARCSIECNGSSGDPDLYYAETPEWTEATGAFWLHFEEAPGSVDALGPYDVLYLYEDGGDACIRIRQDRVSANSRTWQVQYDVGAGWVNAGSTVTLGDTRTNYDLYVHRTDGQISLYSAGTRLLNVTGLTLTGFTGIAKARFFSTIGGRDWSQIIAADEATIGFRLASYYPSGAGTTQTFVSNSYTNIDETVYTDSDYIYADTNGQEAVYAATGPTLTSYTVRGVCVSARAKRGASGPQNAQLSLRVNGVNYNSATKALDVGYTVIQHIWDENPDTTDPWLTAAISALQPGVKAIT